MSKQNIHKIAKKMSTGLKYEWHYDKRFELFHLLDMSSLRTMATAGCVWEMNQISRELKNAGFRTGGQEEASEAYATAKNPEIGKICE